ncbi:hypothetical protein ACEPAF_5398 [Sanghuangporus sanghuang]
MNHSTLRQNARSSKAIEDYILKHHASWLRLVKNLGLPVETHDLILVRECTLTGDWATVVWNESSTTAEISFNVGVSTGPNVGMSIWGQWEDRVTIPKRQGPQRTQENRQAYHNRQFDQCVFLKGLRVALREWYQKLVSLLMARAKEEQGFNIDPSSPFIIRLLKNSGMKVEVIGSGRSSFRPIQSSLDLVVISIFENTDADIAIVDDNDMSLIGFSGSDSLEDMCNRLFLQKNIRFSISIAHDGKKLGRIVGQDSESDVVSEQDLVILDEKYHRIHRNNYTLDSSLDGSVPVDSEAEALDLDITPNRVSVGNPQHDTDCDSTSKHGREVEDLDESISLSREALTLLPDGHPQRPSALSNLADSLRARFERSGRIEDLEDSITLNLAALDHQPEDHSKLPRAVVDFEPFQSSAPSSGLASGSKVSQPLQSVAASSAAPYSRLPQDIWDSSPRSKEISLPSKLASRRTLTRALELAREAVRLDSTGNDPHGAIRAYGESVALLNEVMEHGMHGEVRKGQKGSTAQEQLLRLRSIHDTYANRMSALGLIYNLPTPLPIRLLSRSGSPSAEAFWDSESTVESDSGDMNRRPLLEPYSRASSKQNAASRGPQSLPHSGSSLSLQDSTLESVKDQKGPLVSGPPEEE